MADRRYMGLTAEEVDSCEVKISRNEALHRGMCWDCRMKWGLSEKREIDVNEVTKQYKLCDLKYFARVQFGMMLRSTGQVRYTWDSAPYYPVAIQEERRASRAMVVRWIKALLLVTRDYN